MGRTDDIRRFLLRNIPRYPGSIAGVAAEEFGVTRQAVNRHLRSLAEEGLILAWGRTRAREYELVTREESTSVPVSPAFAEDRLWREWALPQLTELPKDALEVAHYGFTEIVNNAMDHSEGRGVHLAIARSPIFIELVVTDDGVGIFNKIRDAFQLDDERHAVLELAKGKLTTDPARHTGEGIFFTSRMFQQFWLYSGEHTLYHAADEGDWVLEGRKPLRKGTLVRMILDPESGRTTREVFDRFTDTTDGYGFDVTYVPVALARYGEENLVSRSQGRRLVARFERFRKVTLDFDGVEMIGQAFADEVFRVFQMEHPEVHLEVLNTTEAVEQMIRRAAGRLKGDAT